MPHITSFSLVVQLFLKTNKNLKKAMESTAFSRLKQWGVFFLLGATFPLWAQANESGLRGKQYCEIVLSHFITNYSIYNTLGLNDCPESMWNKVTVAQVKRETGSSMVYLNGLRYWVIDGFSHPPLTSKSIKTFNGIKMREAGSLHIKITDLIKAQYPYYKHEVKRQTAWFYEPGKLIYELIDAKGAVYVMQSYSVNKKAQSEKSLAQLGAKLSLPKGWTFKSGILKQAQSLNSPANIAIIVQDNFDNTYQKAPYDFLKDEKNASIKKA